MSGIEIFSLITGIVTITEAITEAYGAIKTLPGLPEAFHAVGKRLPLIESTLQDAKKRERDPMEAEDDDFEALKVLVDDCRDKTEELKSIFLKLSQSKGKPVFQAYQTLVAHMGKKGRVELLMREILRDVATLASYRVFRTATQHQMEELKKAIEEMGQVDPSVPDSLFEERSGTSNHSGQGHIYNFSGSSTLNEVAGSIYNANGNINFGDRDVDSDCLADLRVTDPRDDKKRIEDAKGGLLRDSYCWILDSEEFQKWRTQDIPILWVSGDPGKGKTMSVCGIIDELSPSTRLEDQNSHTLLSYFFCEASDSRVNSASSVLRGILWLLIKQQPSLISCVQENYKHSGKMLFEDRNAWSALHTIFIDLLKGLHSQPVYLIIDALDECREGWKSLVKLIMDQSSCSHVKWIVSSRNRPDIQEALATASEKARLSLELNKDAVAAAVDWYIQYKVNKLAEGKRYSPEMRSVVHSHLSSKSESTFLWVSLACQMLQDAPRWDTLRELEAFPSGLNPLYGRMLQQILGERNDRSKFYRQIVSIMLSVFQPISLDDLRSLAKIPGGMSDDESLAEIIGLCGSFLTLRGRMLYFVHDSAKSFLLNSTRGFIYNGEEHHHLIFSNSLRVMSKLLRRDIYSSESSSPELSKQQRAEDPLAPLRYSCTNWVLHLITGGSDTRNKELVDGSPVDEFLRQHYLHWLEVLGYMKRISAGIVSMMKLESVLLNQTSELARLVQDETRFIRYHRRAIEEVPLQAYTSALVFSPARSMTRDVYRREEPRWITKMPEMEANWSDSILIMEGHTNNIVSISFSPDGRFLASASWDQTAKIWDVVTGECIQTLSGHTEGLTSVAISGKNFLIASASYDCTVKIWEGEQGRCIRTRMDHKRVVHSVAFTQDGSLLASGSDDTTIKLWDSEAKNCFQTFHGHTDYVTSIEWSRDGHFLASISADDSVRIWDPKRKDSLHSFTTNKFSCVAFTPDNKFATASFDNMNVTLWDPATGERLRVIGMDGFRVGRISFAWDGRLLAAGSDSSVLIFDGIPGKCVHKFEEAPRSLLFSPTSHSLASTNGPRIKIRDLPIQDLTRTIQLDQFQPPPAYHVVAFSPDGSLIASATGDGRTKLWCPATAKCVHVMDPFVLAPPVFSADSRLLAVIDAREVQVWDTAAGMQVQRLVNGTAPVQKVALSHNNRWLALAPTWGSIRVWDLTSEEYIQRLGGDEDTARALVFSHDSRYLAAGSENCVKLWDSTLWRCMQTLKVGGNPHTMVFSPDSCWLAVSSSNYLSEITEIKILDLKKATCVAAFRLDQFCTLRTLDPACSLLETTMGMFQLNHHSRRQPRLKGYGLTADREWIVWGADGKLERVLWLPPEHRPRRMYGLEWGTFAFFGSKVAIVPDSGRVMILEFDPEGPFPISTRRRAALFRLSLGGCLHPFHVHRELPLSQRRLSRGSSVD